MKFLIVTEETVYSGIFSVMFDEIIYSKQADIVNQYLEENNFIRKHILDILYKNKINKYLKGCFEPLLKPKLSLVESLKKYKNEDVTVIFTNASLQKVYSENTLLKIKKQFPKIKYVLLLVDSAFQPQAKKSIQLAQKNIFDLVYTYNKDDAEKYGYLYWQTPYSSLAEAKKIIPIEGVYFCGSDKGRAEFLDRIAGVLIKNNIKYNFSIFGNKKVNYKNITVSPMKLRKYEDVLKETLKYNCILDIVQESNGEKCGLSLRAYEAVVYNRILITNNSCIKDFPYYDDSYMHFIRNENDIKKEWFTQKVASNYSGELSPTLFIDNIENKLKIYGK